MNASYLPVLRGGGPHGRWECTRQDVCVFRSENSNFKIVREGLFPPPPRETLRLPIPDGVGGCRWTAPPVSASIAPLLVLMFVAFNDSNVLHAGPRLWNKGRGFYARAL